jgi:hypothetical protein
VGAFQNEKPMKRPAMMLSITLAITSAGGQESENGKKWGKKGRTSRVAVVVLEDTSGNDLELLSERSGVSETTVRRLVGGGLLTLLLVVVLVNLVLNLLSVFRIVPELRPVLVDLCGSTGTNNIEDVCRRDGGVREETREGEGKEEKHGHSAGLSRSPQRLSERSWKYSSISLEFSPMLPTGEWNCVSFLSR